MKLNNIEFSYSKKYIPLKIQYMEKRYPSYIEFLVLSIIYSYPDKEVTIKNVLEKDFDVKNQILFEKALNELVLIKNITLQSNSYQWDKKLVDYKISSYTVSDEVKRSIDSNEYAQTINNKVENIKLFYDDLLNKYDIVRESNWDKKINGAQYFYKFENKIKGMNIKIDQIKKDCKSLMSHDIKNFSKDDVLENILDSNNNVINSDCYKEFESYEQRAVELSLNYDEKKNIVISSCSDAKINQEINDNDQLKLHILLNVLSSYKDSVKEKILPIEKNILQGINISFENSKLIDEISPRINQDVCMINGRYINIFKKLIDDKKLFTNVKYLIVYNSKVNSKIIETYNGKVIFYIGQINSKELIMSSIIFFDNKNNPKSYILSEKLLFNKLNIPVVVENPVFNFSIKDIFKVEEKVFKNEFLKCLNNLDANGIESIITLSKRFDSFKIIEETILSYVYEISKNPFMYNNLISKLEANGCQTSIKIFEKSLLKSVYNLSRPMGMDDVINLIKSFKFINNKNIAIIIDYLKINWSWKQINVLCKFTEEKGLDPWSSNTANCLVKMIEYYMLNQRSGIFLEDEYKSNIYKLHVSFLEKHTSLIKYIYQNNYATARSTYNNFIDEFINMINDVWRLKFEKTLYLNLLNSIFTNIYQNINSKEYEGYIIDVNASQDLINLRKNARQELVILDNKIASLISLPNNSTICTELKFIFYRIKNMEDQSVIDFYESEFPKLIRDLKILYGNV